MGQPATKKRDISAPPRTQSREVRRGQLIDATISSIAEHGISGTTMTTVTGKAGLSMGIVNFHFKSKQNLFEETLVHLAKEHRDHWRAAYDNAALSPEAKLLAIVDAHFDQQICSPEKLAVWFAFYGEAGRRAVYRGLVDQIDEERMRISSALCEDIKRDGTYDQVDAEHIAMTLESMYDGLCLNLLMYPSFFTREKARQQIRAYLALVFPTHFSTPAA